MIDQRELLNGPPVGQLPQGGYNMANAPSLTERLGGMAGGLLQAALHSMELPLHAVQTIAGGGNRENWEEKKRQAALVGASQNDPVAQWLSDRTGVSRYDVARGVGGQVVDYGMDPLSILGMRIPLKLMQAIPAGSRLAPLAPALNALNTGETMTQNMLNTLLLGPLRGVNISGKDMPAAIAPAMNAVGKHINIPGMPEGHIPGAVDALRLRGTGFGRPVYETKQITVPGTGLPELRVTERPAENLYDLLTHQSNVSQFKIRGRQVWDHIDYLTRRGHNAARMVADEEQAAKGSLVYQLNPGTYLSGKTALQGMQSNLEAKLKEAPNGVARAGLVEVIREVNVLNAAAWEQARIQLRDAMSAGLTGAAAREAARNMYKTAVDKIAVNMKAGLDVADDLFMQSGRQHIDPNLDRQLSTYAARAMLGIRKAQSGAASIGMFPIKGSGIRDPKDKMRIRMEEMINVTQGVDRAGNWLQTQIRNIADEDTIDLLDVQNIYGRISQRADEIGYLQRSLPGEMAVLPEAGQGPIKDIHHNLTRYAAQAIKSRNVFVDAMEQAWNKYHPGVPFQKFQTTPYSTAEDSLRWVNQTVDQINAVADPLLGIPSTARSPITNQIDLFKWLNQHVDTPTSQKLQRTIDQFPGTDLIVGNPYVAAGDRAIRGLAKTYGIRDENPVRGTLMDALKTSNNFFREQALTSVTYPLVNAMGALLNSSISGVAPMTQMRTMMGSVAQTMRNPDNYYMPTHIQNFVNATGIVPTGAARGFSSGIIETTAESTRDFTQTGRPVWQQIGRGPLALGGGVAGGASGYVSTPSDATDAERNANIATGAALGAGWLGLAHPAMNKYFVHRMAKGIEDAARGEVWFMGALRAHQESREAYQQIVNNALAAPRGRRIQITGRDAKGLPVEAIRPEGAITTPQADAINAILEKQNYMLTPEVLGSVLRRNGVQNDVAQKAVTQWRNLNSRIAGVGENLAAEVHFDYQNLNNMEQFMREFTPFSTWAFKALPFWAKHLTEKPVIALTLGKYTQEVERSRQDEGLGARFAGSTREPIGFASWFWSQLLGYPVMAFTNPFTSMIPWANSARNVQEQPDETPFETFNRALGVLGLPQVAAPIQLGARLAGISDDAPAQGILPLRAAGMLQGATALAGVNRGRGININAGQVNLEKRVREGLGQEVADPGTTNIMNRIDEAFLREFGRPISAQDPAARGHIQAKAEMSGPIWDWAASKQAKEQGSRAIGSFIYGPGTPQALLSQEEQAIRYTRAHSRVLNPKFSEQIKDAAMANPLAPAPPEMVQTIRDATIYVLQKVHNDPTIPPAVEAMLTSGTFRDMNTLRKHIFEAQAQLAPLGAAYGQSGSAEEARLQNLLALNATIPGQYPEGQLIQSLSRMRGDPSKPISAGSTAANVRVPEILRPTQAAIRAEQTALKTKEPIIAEYLAWRDSNPDGNIEEFFKSRRKPR